MNSQKIYWLLHRLE